MHVLPAAARAAVASAPPPATPSPVAVAGAVAAALPRVLVAAILEMTRDVPFEACVRLYVRARKIVSARAMTLDCEDEQGREVRAARM